MLLTQASNQASLAIKLIYSQPEYVATLDSYTQSERQARAEQLEPSAKVKQPSVMEPSDQKSDGLGIVMISGALPRRRFDSGRSYVCRCSGLRFES